MAPHSGEVSPSVQHDLFVRAGVVWLSPFTCLLVQTHTVLEANGSFQRCCGMQVVNRAHSWRILCASSHMSSASISPSGNSVVRRWQHLYGTNVRRGPHVSGQHVTNVFSSDLPTACINGQKNHNIRLYCWRLLRRNCHQVWSGEWLVSITGSAARFSACLSKTRLIVVLTLVKSDARSDCVMGRVKS